MPQVERKMGSGAVDSMEVAELCDWMVINLEALQK
jgi:hypothetical protein